MHLRALFLSLVAGIATTLLVAAAVTEALLPSIEFSAIVGLPVGVAAGLLVGAGIALVLASKDTPSDQRHAAMAVGVFGVATLAIFALALLVGTTASAALLVAAVGGILVAAGTFVWLRQNDARTVRAVTMK